MRLTGLRDAGPINRVADVRGKQPPLENHTAERHAADLTQPCTDLRECGWSRRTHTNLHGKRPADRSQTAHLSGLWLVLAEIRGRAALRDVGLIKPSCRCARQTSS
ncbi:hypothetical protein [Amycolatopsis sp. FDAARGOS 1241]|uniref:hypothetical protein n=1 Tax=Amycolatopsis sp. FDAARGOS 1241 TaxID=2778070 RepID=UPI00194E5D85|nr:hypothetical protein [Amycolatopsis sp. FDAARGOS 1241]QRP45800.1 hypothetical protein I6J71_43100 [Amycolatopsis sp. FDAARGOS 1241]